MLNKKYVLHLFWIISKLIRQRTKAIHGRTHRNKVKKAVLKTIAYFKVSTSVRLQKR